MKKVKVTILCDRCGGSIPGNYSTEENVSLSYYSEHVDGYFIANKYNMCSVCVPKLNKMLGEFMRNK